MASYPLIVASLRTLCRAALGGRPQCLLLRSSKWNNRQTRLTHACPCPGDLHHQTSYLVFPLCALALGGLAFDLYKRPPGSSRSADASRQGSTAFQSQEGAHSGLVDAVALAALVLYLVVFHALATIPAAVSDQALYREVHGRFWMLPNLLACFLAGLGLSRGALLLDSMASVPVSLSGPLDPLGTGEVSDDGQARSRSRASCIARNIRVGLVLVAWAVLTVQALPESDYHRLNPFRVLGYELLDQLPTGALLLTQGDLITNTVRYVWAVEGHRTDVAVIDQNLLTAVWFTRMQGHHFTDVDFPHRDGRLSISKRRPSNFNCAQLLDANIARRPIYVANSLKDNTWRASYQLVPEGLVQRVFPLRAGPGMAQQYNATRWLEGLLQGDAVLRAQRILHALRPEPVVGRRKGSRDKADDDEAGAGAVEGDEEAARGNKRCQARMGDGGSSAFWTNWAGRRREGFASGSWESKVQLELLAALQRQMLHALHALTEDSETVCSRGSCLGPLENLAQSLESALLHIGDQHGDSTSAPENPTTISTTVTRLLPTSDRRWRELQKSWYPVPAPSRAGAAQRSWRLSSRKSARRGPSSGRRRHQASMAGIQACLARVP